MRKSCPILLLLLTLTATILLSACREAGTPGIDTTSGSQIETESDFKETKEITTPENQESNTKVEPIPQPKGENKVNTLQNYLKKMNPDGDVGSVIIGNENNWVHAILEDNPGLFDGFLNQENKSIFKTMWHGEFPGKLLTGIAQTYLINNDDQTKRVGDAFVEYFKKSQENDGYLGPWDKRQRFESDVSESNWGKWDTWGQYHCIYGLYRWYQVTGNRDALDVANRALDHIYDHFITGEVSIAEQNWAECNLAIGHAFALFYEETGDERYLAAAERLVNQDWNDTYRDFYTNSVLCCGWMNAALEGKPYCESGQPRWEGLYALETLAVLYRITGKEIYLKALDELWWGMYETDRHNTGSFGTGEGATGNLYGAGSETCNTVAWMAFSTDYLKISRNSRVADELELSFFNATLGSLLDGERNFTYMNNSDGKREPARTVLEGHSYVGGRDMSCCQANGNRGLTQISEWALLTDENSLYLNYYGACSLETYIQNGHMVTISEDTAYPKDGTVRIRVSTACPEELTLYLRIPSWSNNTVLTVNGQPVFAEAGTYCAITRKWSETDEIELHLDMTPHFWVMDQGAVSFKLSVYSGPMLLAFRTSENLTGTVRFDINALRNITPTDGDGIVNFTIESEIGKTVVLTDYYTAGKNGDTFVSWITCISGLKPLPSERNKTPVWCNR